MSVNTVKNRTVLVNGASVIFTAADAVNARRWHNDTSDQSLGRGRIAGTVLTAWLNAGRPIVEPPLTVVATIEYRKLDKLGRVNGAARYRDIHAHNMPGGRGRPASMSYIHASGLELDSVRIDRIVTANGAIHSVTLDESDDIVITWESKADQRAIIVALLATIAERDETIERLQG